MKKIFPILILILLVGCAVPENAETVKVAQQQTVYSANQPVPAFDWSLERDVLIQLYMARNEALSTYTVVVDSHGGTIYECPSIGYPIPAETQLTAPEAAYNDPHGSYDAGSVVLPQAEPNGLYASGSFGTWVMCVMEDGTVYPYYTEMNAQTWPFWVERGEDGIYHPIEGAKPSKTLDVSK